MPLFTVASSTPNTTSKTVSLTSALSHGKHAWWKWPWTTPESLSIVAKTWCTWRLRFRLHPKREIEVIIFREVIIKHQISNPLMHQKFYQNRGFSANNPLQRGTLRLGRVGRDFQRWLRLRGVLASIIWIHRRMLPCSCRTWKVEKMVEQGWKVKELRGCIMLDTSQFKTAMYSLQEAQECREMRRQDRAKSKLETIWKMPVRQQI